MQDFLSPDLRLRSNLLFMNSLHLLFNAFPQLKEPTQAGHRPL
jgi:hypothetical protein